MEQLTYCNVYVERKSNVEPNSFVGAVFRLVILRIACPMVFLQDPRPELARGENPPSRPKWLKTWGEKWVM